MSNRALKKLPILPLKDVVLFPGSTLTLFIGRKQTLQAVDVAEVDYDGHMLLLTEKHNETVSEEQALYYDVATVCRIVQKIKISDSSYKLLVEAQSAALIEQLPVEGAYTAQALVMDPSKENVTPQRVKRLKKQFSVYCKQDKKLSSEMERIIEELQDVEQLVYTMASHLKVSIALKQSILAESDLAQRLELLSSAIAQGIDLQLLEKKIQARVKQQVEKNHKEYYLKEQMNALRKEMDGGDIQQKEQKKWQEKIQKAKLPAYAKEQTEEELQRLLSLQSTSSEANVIRNYLSWLCKLPWQKKSPAQFNLSKAITQLDIEHYGLDDIKTRIIEYLAVQKKTKQQSGPILCFVGPPGVGKTSLASSIAKSMGRKFERIALGGLKDEAELRGHRRTYIGAMPGRVIQRLAKAKVNNPVILLDEVDKMGAEHRGDPSAALLEILDPEQNHQFHDHYIELDFDLSKVLFIATSNSLNIPPALRDRMEIIRLSSYTEAEKVAIATKHLLPKQWQRHGLNESECVLQSSAITSIIRYYTREAGVRQLERSLAKIGRKVVKTIVSEEIADYPVRVTEDNIEQYLGVPQYEDKQMAEKESIGQVIGLAWTETGGEILTIEAVAVPGDGKTRFTGRLGDVMQESIHAALSVIRLRYVQLNLDSDFYKHCDMHVHVPAGATPKDGPSAGIAMCVAIISTLTSTPVRPDIAMTGEITLRGEVLAIGGVKEKVLAAVRAGIYEIILPEKNRKDIVDVPEEIRTTLTIHYAQHIDEVLNWVFKQHPFDLSLPVGMNANVDIATSMNKV